MDEHDEHRTYNDYAVRHVMGGLNEAESGKFRAHLLDCSECRARVGELRSIASDLDEVERSERRVRATQLLETKERDLEELDYRYREHPGQNTRFVTVVGLFLVVTLSVWAFVLRDRNEELLEQNAQLQAATATINFGDRWQTETLAPGRDGIVRSEGDGVSLMIRGTDDDSRYALRVLGENGVLLRQETLRSRNGVVQYFEEIPIESVQIDVSLIRGAGTETLILRANRS